MPVPLPDLAVITVGLATFCALAVFVIDTTRNIVRSER
jgi:hypothetical protein